jgi:hypothetical protein
MRPLNLQNDSEPGRLAPGAGEPRGLSPRTRLAACLAVLTVCWLLVLPLVARTPAVSSMVERNGRLGIDPSAKFYSELPAMPQLRQRMEAVRADGGDAFWRPGQPLK